MYDYDVNPVCGYDYEHTHHGHAGGYAPRLQENRGCGYDAHPYGYAYVHVPCNYECGNADVFQ